MTILKYFDKTNNFKELFNSENGFYIRTGVLDKNGKDTNVDPFMREFPSLLDVGVMGNCKNAKHCTVGCYQGKLAKPNMSLDTFKGIIDQCKGKTFEVALGGFGSPNEHEDFVEIVKYAHDNGVIPNYTTSGIELTDEQIDATKKYCGAVAVSWYRMTYTYDAINRFIEAGCKTNIHYVLSDRSIDEALWHLGNNDFPEGVNAVIFLLFKPVGCGKNNDVLHYSDPRVERFFYAIENSRLSFKVGLDACCMPGVVNFSKKIDPISTTACDSGRFSAYISCDNFMLPCSFDNITRKYAYNLLGHTIQDAWDSKEFDMFRNYHKRSCMNCLRRDDCSGGCLLAPEINLCERKEREYAI